MFFKYIFSILEIHNILTKDMKIILGDIVNLKFQIIVIPIKRVKFVHKTANHLEQKNVKNCQKCYLKYTLH